MDTKAFARDIAEVARVLNRVATRPCVNKDAPGQQRGTIVAYSELTHMRTLLSNVLVKLEA